MPKPESHQRASVPSGLPLKCTLGSLSMQSAKSANYKGYDGDDGSFGAFLLGC